MRALFLLLAATVLSSPVAAQHAVRPDTSPAVSPGLVVGARAMLLVGKGRHQRQVSGRVLEANAEVVVLAHDGDTLRVPRAEVRAAWIGEARGSRSVSAGKGALAGLFAGGLLGYAAGDDCGGEDWICFDRSATTPAGALLGAGVGALVGALVVGGERWRQVPVSASVSIGLPAPRPTRAGVPVLALRF